jgi:uncharacterized protein YndB with AHSA1/START domain
VTDRNQESLVNDATLHTIEQRVRIAASPETVWTFWTDPEHLRQWWGSAAELDPRPGGAFRVVMNEGGPVMRGQYLELHPHSRLVFSFGWEQQPPGQLLRPCSTRVEVTLTAVGDETDLLLRHSQLPAEHAAEHAKGWALFVGERLPDIISARAR